ncbi:MAG: hypothetical protein DID90_2727554114 [Candidatus Nitrotoga sp. LAW]|nr:MAG: hypothetical protein DID90_2727554114 [Candidatus Nitrotoga sp. LAW]
MFYRIVVDVIDVLRKINLIPDLILPILPLPDAALALGLAAGTNVSIVS